MRKAYDTGEVLNALVDEIGEFDPDEQLDVVRGDDDSANVPIPDPAPQPEPEDKPEPVVDPAPEPEADPVKAGVVESRPWSDDYNQLKTELDFLRGQRVQPSQPQQQQQAAPKPLREISDTDEYAQRMEQMEQQAHAAFGAVKSLEMQNAKRVMQELKQELPDIDQFIQDGHLMQGVDMRLKQGSLGADWKEPLLRVYDLATGGKRHQSKQSALESRVKELEAELQRHKDEVAAKRTERQEKETRAASMVPAGGGVYQESSRPPVPQVTGQFKGRRSYDASAKAMQQALAQLGG